MNFLLPIGTLWWRELVRFYRQRSRLFGALGTPLVFWLLIGSGIGTSFRPPAAPAEMNYLEYFYPGTIVLIILFTAIFSTISVIEDRREGFLLSVLVAPMSRSGLALGKISVCLGGSSRRNLHRLAKDCTPGRSPFHDGIFTDSTGVHFSLVDGFHPGLSRGDESFAFPHVAALGCGFSSFGGFDLGGMDHEDQSPGLSGGRGTAYILWGRSVLGS